MKRMIMIAVLAVSLAGFAGLASAQELPGGPSPRIHAREWRQEQRIRQGRRQGDLTPREYGRLQAGERHIRAYEHRARLDGRFTMRERARVNRMQNRESRRIWRLRHNGRSV